VTHTKSYLLLHGLGVGTKHGSILLAEPWRHRVVSIHEYCRGARKLQLEINFFLPGYPIATT